MTVELHQYAKREIEAQGLSVQEFANRAGLGVSHAYQILRGDRINARQQTFEAVARGLGITPAELAVALGKGAPDADPARAALHALLREVPDEDLPTIERVVRPFAVQPTRNNPTTRRRDASANRLTAKARQLDSAPGHDAESGESSTIPPCSPRVIRLRQERFGHSRGQLLELGA